ncbi:hypothetical protein [Ideonella sp.]|jgi:hypothetical protein|uniref:hypothetical protein n=1 Tax=Ideonella sp. TaxID=1929293 RepID=UPI0035AF51C8
MFHLLDRAASALKTLADLFLVLRQRRHRRFLLLFPVLALIAMVMAAISSSGALAPFVYPLF